MTRLLTALLAGTALLGSVGANAVTITQGNAVFAVPTDVTGNTIGTFNLFDTTLGTLNSITFTTGYGFTSTITVTAGSTGASGDTQTESAMKFLSSVAAITSVLNSKVNIALSPQNTSTVHIGNSTLSPLAYNLYGNDNTFTLDPNTSQTFTSATVDPNTGGQDVGRNFAADTTAGDLAAFSAAGGGTFTVNFTTLTGAGGFITSGNANSSQTTSVDAGFGLYYDYTPTPPATVPEPASMAILGAGLLGAGLVRRRSRK